MGITTRAHNMISEKIVASSDPKERKELVHALLHLGIAAESLTQAGIAIKAALDEIGSVETILPDFVITPPPEHEHCEHHEHEHDHATRPRGRRLRRPRKPR